MSITTIVAGITATQGADSVTAATIQVQRMNTILGGVPCANESVWPSANWIAPNAVFSSNTRKSYITNRAVSYVRLVFSLQGQTGLIQGGGIRAAVEYPTGIYTQVTFSGRITGTVDGGYLLVSDPVDIPIPTATQFWVRIYNNAPNQPHMDSSIIPTVVAQGEGCDAAFNTSRADKTITGTIGTNAVAWFGPFCVVGDIAPNSPFVGLAGDSIMAGLGDVTFSVLGRGFGRRAMNNTIPFVNVAISGIQTANYPTGRLAPQLSVLNACSHIVDEIGINDIILNGTSPSALETNLINAALLMSAASPGVLIYRTTLTPATTSSDVWATLANQTVTANEANRLSFNAWVRDGLPVNSSTFAPVATGTVGALRAGQTGHPYAGFIDIEATVSGLNGGNIVWAVGSVYTASLSSGISLHPNTTGHIAAAVPLNALAVTWGA